MKTLALSIVLSTFLAPLSARAEELNLRTVAGDDTPANRVHLTTGAEYGFVAGVGYSRILPVLDRRIVVMGDATLPWAGLDLGDYRVRAGVLVPIVGKGGWQLAGALQPSVRGNHTKINSMTDVGLDTSLRAGYYARRWFVALESGVDLALTTHVTHTDAYRMNHAGAKDGWYADPGANIRGGAQAGISIDRYDVTLRVGQVRDSAGDAPVLPFYGTLSVAAGW